MAVSAGVAFAAIGAGAGVASAVSANKARKQQKKASDISLQRQEEQIVKAEEAATKEASVASKRQPERAGLRRQNVQEAKSGIASTMLTGPGGIDPSTLSLGRNVLLGG